MRRPLGALALAGAIAALQVAAVHATTPSPAPCPTPAAATGSRTTCPSPDPNQAAYDQLRSRLSGDVARALAAEQRLSTQLDQYAAAEQALSGQITQEESVISELENQIADLNTQISDTQDKIDVEKQQVAVLTVAIDRQPSSLWLLIARTGNLREALQATADMVVAGQRAHALQTRLEADLARLQADLQKRQDQLDKENATLDLLNANLGALQDVMSTQDDVSSELSDLVSQIQSAQGDLQNQPPDVTSTLAQLLESQEQDLIQRSYEQAWTQAQVGAGLAMISHWLPPGQSLGNLTLAWPMVQFKITQPFGPTSVLLEPPLGPYAHFHTGIDMAAPLGTPVMAAAGGAVVAVGHGAFGYGNYVVIAHGGGIETLYGHLLSTLGTTIGEQVTRGQVIGLEGSTGFSTGPHCHFELRVDNQVVDPMPYLPVPGTSWAG